MQSPEGRLQSLSAERRAALLLTAVESFSLDRLRNLTMEQINERYEAFKLMSQFEAGE